MALVEWFAGGPGMLMALWYAVLFVVIEGFEELRLPDERVSNLLTSPQKDLLRRFRNGIFHYQRDYFDGRVLGLVSDQQSAEWILTIHVELGRALLELLSSSEKEDPIPPVGP